MRIVSHPTLAFSASSFFLSLCRSRSNVIVMVAVDEEEANALILSVSLEIYSVSISHVYFGIKHASFDCSVTDI